MRDLFPENVYEALRKRLYVDDGHGGGSTLPKALLLKKNLIDAMARGGFSLSKWKTNHPALLHHESGEPAPVVEDKLEKILGVHWNPFQDNFRFVWDVKQFKLPARTPRELISVSSSLYDPNGFIAPFIMLGRQFLQRAQKGRRGWDTPLDPDLMEEFFLWASSIPLLRNYPVPRWWENDATMDAKNIQWHFQSDACLTGYGAVVYRRAVSDAGDIYVALIMARAHVVPLDLSKASHHGSIVKLELIGLGNQMDCRKFLINTFGELVGQKVHWTDSECCLKQVKDMTTCFPTFTANRLSVIHEVSQPEEWRHVPSADNCADMCARGIKADEAEKWRRFHRGPEYLWKPESEWPKIKDYFKPKPLPTATIAATSSTRTGT